MTPARLKLMLAPVRGITDVVYREAFARYFGGMDVAVAPFILLKQGHPLRPVELKQLAPELNTGMPVIPQVLTNHAPSLLSAMRELRMAGHEEVNWNLGCPHETTAGRGRGAGLLPHPNRIAAILDDVMKDAPARLSVKMRLGYHDADEFKAVLAVLNGYPLRQVILHARTADQMYEGAVDVERARQACDLCRHPFVYNGDITTLEGFQNLQRQLPAVDTWMIGRGALRNPFLPTLLKGGTVPEIEVRQERIRKFQQALNEGYGQWLSGNRHRLDRMKAQGEYLPETGK